MFNVFSKSFRFSRIFGWQHSAARSLSYAMLNEISSKQPRCKDMLTKFAMEDYAIKERLEAQKSTPIPRPAPVSISPPKTIPVPTAPIRRAAVKRNGGVRGSTASRWK